MRWQKSRTRPQRIIYPYHPEKLRVRSLKPIKAFESYVLTQEKFREAPQQDGTYLMPTVTVLVEATLAPTTRKLAEPAPTGPILLHINFPCRPESGLCWPDGAQELQSTPVRVTGAPPTRGPATSNPAQTKPPIPTQAPTQAPVKTPATEPTTAPAPKAN